MKCNYCKKQIDSSEGFTFVHTGDCVCLDCCGGLIPKAKRKIVDFVSYQELVKVNKFYNGKETSVKKFKYKGKTWEYKYQNDIFVDVEVNLNWDYWMSGVIFKDDYYVFDEEISMKKDEFDEKYQITLEDK